MPKDDSVIDELQLAVKAGETSIQQHGICIPMLTIQHGTLIEKADEPTLKQGVAGPMNKDSFLRLPSTLYSQV
jgi:hypothetical protein